MKRFARLFQEIDGTTRTNAKVDAMARYLREAPKPDRLWTVALFSGRRPRRAVTTTRLREWAAERAGLPLWLVEESYPVVGDLAETIALILPLAEQDKDQSLSYWIAELSAIAALPEENRKPRILDAWNSLNPTECFLFNKLITGGFRIGVSQKLMTRALASATGRPEAEMAHRIMGDWTPGTTTWDDLILADDPGADASRPYPFHLAHGLPGKVGDLGDPAHWQAELKWDGIRGQLVLRDGQHFLWSRGEELITDSFPEFTRSRDFLPAGTVLDGELLAWERDTESPLPFARLQNRVGRKRVPARLLAETPVILHAYDLLESAGKDLRASPLETRRAHLETLCLDLPPDAPVRLAPVIEFQEWAALTHIRANARKSRAEGVMLKQRASPYEAGRKRGSWWKWKLDPFTVDAVMIYAQSGHGRRANLFTDFTFALWNGDQLVPFTKAYSGLTDEEFREITAWVRRNTLERYGPVRQVRPELVFEIAFEGIQRSSRHKSGIALRFPRMLRWRRDKPAAEAENMGMLKDLLEQFG